MTEKEIKDKLDNIIKNMRLIDSIVYVDYKTNEGKLTEKQCNIVRELFEFFQELGWNLSLVKIRP
jgi:hypothetical protein